ncbi:MAG: hypothetical protein U0794_02975 [Isosphaeraceae bacterium]
MKVCLLAIVAGWVGSGIAAAPGAAIEVDRAMHHLGRVGQPEWREFATRRPEGDSLTLRFPAQPNAAEGLLRLRQSNVKLDRAVRLNGRRLGRLVLDESDLIHELTLPAGTLRDGENVLEIAAAAQADDVLVGEIQLFGDAAAARSQQGRLDVTVVESPGLRALPCRLTVVDSRGVLVPLIGLDGRLAVRPGVAYTTDGRASLAVAPGDLVVYASRGFEYGVARQEVRVEPGGTVRVALRLKREVDTAGWVATDTHVHTLTHSGHGDATADERLITLAGEGIELPVATEHNRLVDLAPDARRLGLGDALTPVVGDEVTTARGHFNAFPFHQGEAPPDAGLTSWSDLIRTIRGGHDARFIILNHPRPACGLPTVRPDSVQSRRGRGSAGNSLSLQRSRSRQFRGHAVRPDARGSRLDGALECGEEITAVGATTATM